MVQLKRIGVGSALKVGAILYGLTFAIFGFIGLAFQGLFLGLLSSGFGNGTSTLRGSGAALFGTGIVGLCIFYAVGLVFSVVAGGIFAAVYAILYNLVAGWVGGLELDLRRVQAPADTLPPIQQ